MPPAAPRGAPHVVIVGAGVGGLAAAIRLRAAGLDVTLLERASAPGGKMRELEVGGRTFDGGPTVLTMPHVFDELFAAAGMRREDFVRFRPVEPACRHFFADGTVLDLHNDEPSWTEARRFRRGRRIVGADEPWARSAAEIERVLGGTAAEQYRRFRRHAAFVYDSVERPFLTLALPRNPLALFITHDIRDAVALARTDSSRSVWRSLSSFFDDPHLLQLFARYATYSGSDPFFAPATLNVIPHVELGFGLHSVEGGMYRLVEALAALAVRLGARLRCGVDVERVELDRKERRAVAVHAGGERIAADAVVVNADVAQLAHRLLDGTRWADARRPALDRLPPSLSAFVHLAVVRPTGPVSPLRHHNVFFSPDYQTEFAQLTSERRPPEDPTVYLCAPDWERAGERQRWFLLSNAPALPLSPTEPSPAWLEGAAACRARIGRVLARHGLDLDAGTEAARSYTPADFATLFPGSRGSLYGAASNSRLSAFRRPPNRALGLGNVYCVGGSTHPGAGVPMVALSARISAGLVARELL